MPNCAHKPILLYWLIMSAYDAFGVNEFAARFWSAALAVGTALATYGIGRRLFDASVGVWAAVILVSSLMFAVAGRSATPDSALIFFSTAALLVYVLAAFPADGTYFPQRWWAASRDVRPDGLGGPGQRPRRRGTADRGNRDVPADRAAAGNRSGAGRPAWRRWLLRLRPPIFALLHFLRTCWSMRPLTAIVVMLAVAAPWYAWVGWRTDGEFLRVFFWDHNLGRAAQAMEGHSGGLWFYPVAILVGFFPWSVFAVPVVSGCGGASSPRASWCDGLRVCRLLDRRLRGRIFAGPDQAAQLRHALLPGPGLLTACFVRHWTRGLAAGWRRWPAGAIVTLGLVGLAIAVAIPLGCPQVLARRRRGWRASD